MVEAQHVTFLPTYLDSVKMERIIILNFRNYFSRKSKQCQVCECRVECRFDSRNAVQVQADNNGTGCTKECFRRNAWQTRVKKTLILELLFPEKHGGALMLCLTFNRFLHLNPLKLSLGTSLSERYNLFRDGLNCTQTPWISNKCKDTLVYGRQK